jgi:hypothetical protein
MTAINSEYDPSDALERVVAACAVVTEKSRDIETAISSLDVIERAFLDALTHAPVVRSRVIKEFASFLDTSQHEYQMIEHKAAESLKKISQAIYEERDQLNAVMEKVNTAHLELARWTNSVRGELSGLEKTVSEHSTTLGHISEQVDHQYLSVYSAASHAEGDVGSAANQCHTFLSGAVEQLASHCAQLESLIQQCTGTLCHSVDEQSTGFATYLQQLTDHELAPGVSTALERARRGLEENVKTLIEQAAGEVNSSVQDGRSRTDSHRQNVLNVFLPTDGNVKELDDVFKPLGDLVDRVGDLARGIGFLG